MRIYAKEEGAMGLLEEWAGWLKYLGRGLGDNGSFRAGVGMVWEVVRVTPRESNPAIISSRSEVQMQVDKAKVEFRVHVNTHG